jgi:hypothetical protein
MEYGRPLYNTTDTYAHGQEDDACMLLPIAKKGIAVSFDSSLLLLQECRHDSGRIRDTAKNATLRGNHFQCHVVKVGSIRSASVRNGNGIKATIAVVFVNSI